jgi:hypothetical protein
VPFREIAEAIGRGIDVPAVSIAPDKAIEHFDWFSYFATADVPASSERTRRTLGWTPTQPALLEDLGAGFYFSDGAKSAVSGPTTPDSGT